MSTSLGGILKERLGEVVQKTVKRGEKP